MDDKKPLPKGIRIFNKIIQWMLTLSFVVFLIFPKTRDPYAIVVVGVLGLLILISVTIHLVILLIKYISKRKNK
ncbi:MAG: hypothetical protein Q8Q90_01385 [bacterium]|nr:hypothetical protein [bacterium]